MAAVILAFPGLAFKSPRVGCPGRQRRLDPVLDLLEGGADPVAEGGKPEGRFGLEAVGGVVGGHHGLDVSREGVGKAPVWRRASPSIMAAVTATLSERNPGRMGISRRASAASWTASGTPADSRPTRMMSSAR